MTVATFLAYSCALFIAAVIPGPGMTAILARALGSGARPTFFMGFGLILGDLTYLTAVILGLAYIAQTFAEVFLAIKFAGAAYLGYLAWRLWNGTLLPQDVQARADASLKGAFLSGLFVTLGNPKTMLFYVALVPTLVPLDAIGVGDYLALVGITFSVLMVALLPYIVLAARARSLLRRPAALKMLNRTAAGILAGTAAVITARAA
ncbi:MAG TPA: LysE family translocator [Candidatus Sulfotelmatobacter sp.]|jgi:threonine/homoserine/homoserine lactone efflux protein|nr:LysE family translocator [Candidatus Sulfotelmatobacter sp.]